jgi:hypothetical protein
LEQDVKSINSAIDIFVSNGGDLTGLEDPQDILNRMKSARSSETSAAFVGMTGSTIEKRLAARLVPEGESKLAAVWNAAKSQFEIREGATSGVQEFYLDEAFAEVEYKAAERHDSLLNYDTKPGWIWAYEDRNPAPIPGPTEVVVGSTPDTVLPTPPRKLDPPNFSIGGGAHPESDFPLSLSLLNPNHSSTWIMASVNGGAFFKYSGPISIPVESSIVAYAIGDPSDWIQSGDRYAAYSVIPSPPPVQLLPPSISLSAAIFDESVSEISVSLSNPNRAGSSQLYYSLVPPGEGHGNLSDWKRYSGAIVASVSDFPIGFEVAAYARSNDTKKFLDSVVTTAFTRAEFFNIPITGDILFVVDASSSMNRAFGSSTRFATTINELNRAIRAMPTNLRFNVAMFDNGIRWSDDTFEIHPATDTFKQSLISQMSKVDPGAGTNYTAALEIATMFTPRPRQVILLSDGQPNDTKYRDYLNQLAAEGIRIDTIGLDIGGSTANILGEIAAVTKGVLQLVEE